MKKQYDDFGIREITIFDIDQFIFLKTIFIKFSLIFEAIFDVEQTPKQLNHSNNAYIGIARKSYNDRVLFFDNSFE